MGEEVSLTNTVMIRQPYAKYFRSEIAAEKARQDYLDARQNQNN